MSRESRYQQLLQTFAGRPSFTAAEAVQAGLTHQALSRFTKLGAVKRISRGHYRIPPGTLTTETLFEDMATTASTVPNGVICLISALKYHDLTEEIPRAYWIAVPHSQYPPVRPHMRVVRMRNIELGRTSATVAGIRVRIFDAERCIVDAFRYLSQEIAIKALKAYFLERKTKPNIPKLTRYAKMLRVNLDPFIASILI